ncbi:MAG: Gfo/Idh/MocA family oxidoreductase [Acetobacteraceae bacterium]|nr:Gfo/Idh/MocA family oxidoreductase [Acetobacteraceae bacterium]
MVGTSRIAGDFARALARVDGSRLQAVVSRNPENARRFAAEHGAVKAHPDVAALLSDSEIDVVYLAAPTHAHHRLGLAVVQAGKHLLCEKPFTASVGEAEELVAAARRNGVFCMEAMWLRFNAAIEQCRADLSSGRLGHASSMTVEVGYLKDLTKLGTPEAGRGATAVFGCYGLSLALFLFGEPREVRVAAARNAAGVDLDAAFILDYGQKLVTVLASVSATLSNELRIFGSEARIVVPAPFLDAERRIIIPDGSGRAKRLLNLAYEPVRKRLPKAKAAAGSGLRGEIAEVTRCLDQGLSESPVMPLGDTLAVHALMQKLKRTSV